MSRGIQNTLCIFVKIRARNHNRGWGTHDYTTSELYQRICVWIPGSPSIGGGMPFKVGEQDWEPGALPPLRSRSKAPGGMSWAKPQKLTTLFVKICHFVTFLQRAQCSHCKRCISYSNSVCLSVRPSVRLSVRHTPVLCQNGGT